MANLKITKKLVDALEPTGSDYIIWDSDLTGFGVRVRASGHAVYIVQYRAGSGRAAPTRKVTIGPVTKLAADEARSIAKRTIVAVMNGEDPAVEKATRMSSPSIKDLTDKWLAFAKAKRSKNTYALYETFCRLYVVPRFGAKKAIDVTTGDLSRFHLDLKDKPSTANRSLNMIAAMYNWAMDEDHIPAVNNPADKVERYPEEGRERYLTLDEYQKLHEVLDQAEEEGLVWHPEPENNRAPKAIEDRTIQFSVYVIAAIRLFLFTGARLREILKMRWDHYDKDRGIVHLPESKGGKDNIILSEAAIAVIEDLPRSGEYIIAGADPKKPRHDIKRPWNRIRKTAGLDGVRIHDLRHSFASMGVGNGYGLPIIGQLLRHKQIKSTLKYAHLDAEPVRNVSNEIGKKINAAMKKGRKSGVFDRSTPEPVNSMVTEGEQNDRD